MISGQKKKRGKKDGEKAGRKWGRARRKWTVNRARNERPSSPPFSPSSNHKRGSLLESAGQGMREQATCVKATPHALCHLVLLAQCLSLSVLCCLLAKTSQTVVEWGKSFRPKEEKCQRKEDITLTALERDVF